MNADQRRQVLSNARYLRSVRPVDPDEIFEYVEGRPHPAAVRQVLRERAVDIGLVEREDGTFVPVEEGPLDVAFRGVERFPPEHAERFEELLVAAYGPDWPHGESGDRLRERVRRLKADYYRGREVAYDEETALAYGLYHLPDYYAAVQYVLADPAADGLLPRRLRVLDVGAGVGGPALGVHDLLPDDALVDYHAVEPSAAADVFEHLLEPARPGFRTTLHRETAEAFDPGAAVGAATGRERGRDGGPDGSPDDRGGDYDLVLFANVLSELDEPVAVAERYLAHLAPDGSFVALAPADRETATALRSVERALDDSYTVYGPTVRLWPGESPTDRGWSFDVRPDLAVPGFQRRLDEGRRGDDGAGRGNGAADGDRAPGDGEFVNVDVQYAYAVLRRDGRRALDATPDPARHAKMAEMDRHVTERVDLLAVKLSRDLSDGGEGANPLFKVGDGSERVDHFAVLTRESALNRDLRLADYGDLLAFENVLVLWNDDEGAYNLVVDEETLVDRLPA